MKTHLNFCRGGAHHCWLESKCGLCCFFVLLHISKKAKGQARPFCSLTLTLTLTLTLSLSHSRALALTLSVSHCHSLTRSHSLTLSHSHTHTLTLTLSLTLTLVKRVGSTPAQCVDHLVPVWWNFSFFCPCGWRWTGIGRVLFDLLSRTRWNVTKSR